VATPVANAEADAECPDGNDVERGIATWRATGNWWVSRSGRRRPPSGFRTTFTIADVTPTDTTPLTAARRPGGPPVVASRAALASHSLE
jgi:hypothetical protein